MYGNIITKYIDFFFEMIITKYYWPKDITRSGLGFIWVLLGLRRGLLRSFFGLPLGWVILDANRWAFMLLLSCHLHFVESTETQTSMDHSGSRCWPRCSPTSKHTYWKLGTREFKMLLGFVFGAWGCNLQALIDVSIGREPSSMCREFPLSLF